jgi:hypothetical protein
MGAGGVASAMEQATEGRRNVWLILTEPELWDSRGLVQEWFESNGALLSSRSFARVDVYLYSLGAEEAKSGRRVS